MSETSSMKMITINIPRSWLDKFNKLIENNYYPNRSELIRYAIGDLLREEERVGHLKSRIGEKINERM